MSRTPAPAPGLSVSQVTVRFGEVTAVDDVSLGVEPGRVLALLGPSGCGKSTLLRAIAGLIEPAGRAVQVTGRIVWDGQDLSRTPTHRRGFGLMFQSGELFGHLDVAGNVGYGLKVAKVGAAPRAERVAEMLRLVGLEGFERRRVATLSGGEAQRVALARALAPRPKLLLLDEPLSALDRARREHLAAQMRQILLAAGATAIFVTHDVEEAMTLADQIAIMSAGRILQRGDAEQLWFHPATGQAARLLGFRDFLPARRDGWRASGPWGSLDLSPGASAWARWEEDGAARRGPVHVALRPGALEARADGELCAIVRGPARSERAGRVQPCELAGGMRVAVVVGEELAIGAELAVGVRPNLVALVDDRD